MVKPNVVAEFHAVPINYEVAPQIFEACDTILIPEQNWEFEYVNRRNNFTSYFNDRTDPANPTLASFEIINSQGAARWINYKMCGITGASQGIPEGNEITYYEVFPGIDLRYIVDTWRLKEDIIIKQPVEHYGYKFTLKLDPNVILEQQEDGSIDFIDTVTQERLWGIAKPYDKDAEVKETYGVRYILGKETYNGVEYDSIEVVIEDAYFIQNAIYPIVIDPTTEYSITAGSTDDGWVSSNFSGFYPPTVGTWKDSTGNYIKVRKNKDTSGGTNWVNTVGLVRFNTAALPDTSIVISALLKLCYSSNNGSVDGRSVYGDYYAFSSIDMAHYIAEGGMGAFAKTMASILANPSNTIISIDLSNVGNIDKTGYTGFRMTMSGGQPNGMNEVDFWTVEASTSSYRPKLSVTYTIPPTTPTLQTPNGGEAYNESCNITWTASTDPDGDSLTYHLQYSPDNGSNWYDIITGKTGTSHVWDTSALTPGIQYLVRIRAYDGYSYSSYDQSNAIFTIQHVTDKVNIGGVLKEVDKRYVNIGGLVKEVDWVKVDIGGVLKDT
jgi:hypothetical protein